MGSFNQAANGAAAAYSGIAFVASGLAVFGSVNVMKPCAAPLWPGGSRTESPFPNPPRPAICNFPGAEQIGSWSDLGLGLVVAVAVAAVVFFWELLRRGNDSTPPQAGEPT